jgi:hypothetical protein
MGLNKSVAGQFKPAFKQKIFMTTELKELIKKAYSAFNERDIDKALSTMQPNVQWSKAWEGGYINGHNEIKEYWTRQWKEINPNVEPFGFTERQNGSLEVEVHQKVKDLQDNSMFDGKVKHIYTFENGLIKTMDIELVDNN